MDFGLMTQITDNQKFGMIEAISHLVHRDYEGIGDDFKRLDFIPEEVRRAFVVQGWMHACMVHACVRCLVLMWVSLFFVLRWHGPLG